MKLMMSAAAAALTAALLAGSAASAQTYDRLVVFGDSLSDNGNTFRASGGTTPPSPPYFQGRFSNGPVFTELLGFQLNSFPTVTGNTNFAFGGAETSGPGRAGVPPLRVQLDTYLAAGGQFDANDLVTVYGGGNNLLNAFPQVGAAPNPVAAMQAIAAGAAADIGAITSRVSTAGAGTIAVFNLPGFGGLPAFNTPSTAAAAPLAELGSQTFNAALLGQLNALAGAGAQANIILVDVNRFDAYVRSRPGDFGFTNISQSCLNTTTGQVCANPDQFLFWDSVHPTAASNRYLAALTTDYIYYGTRGAPTAAIGETGLEHRQAAQDAALERLEDAGDEPGLRFALGLEGARSSEDERGAVPEIERNTAAIRVAIDAPLGQGGVMGVLLSGSESDVEAGALTFTGSSYGAEGYLGFDTGPVFVNLVLGAAGDEYNDYRRVTGVGPVSHDAGRVTGSSYGAKLRAGLRLPVGAGSLSPRASLGVIRTEVDAFNENGPAARHAQRTQEIEAATAEASLRFETPIGTGLRAHAEAGYGAFLSYDGDVATALVDNPAKPLGVAVEEPGRGFLLNLGLQGAVFGEVQLGAAYRGRFDDGSDSHAALLTLSLRR